MLLVESSTLKLAGKLEKRFSSNVVFMATSRDIASAHSQILCNAMSAAPKRDENNSIFDIKDTKLPFNNSSSIHPFNTVGH